MVKTHIPLCPVCGGPCTGNIQDGFETMSPNYEEEITAIELQERIATALENIWEELRLRNRARGVFPE